MQEGTLFFLLSWLAVWYIVFMDNGPARKRSRYLAVLFAILVCAGIYMNIVNMRVNFIWVPVLFWSFFQWRRIQSRNLFLVAVTVFGVMVTFSCFRILTMLYPVWLFIDWKILCSFLVVVMSVFFQKERKLRLSTGFIGSFFGQILFAALLSYNGMPVSELFSLETLDFLSLIMLFNGILHGLEQWRMKRSARKSFMTVSWRNREMR